MKQEITVALVGNPNSGKSSLFNALTGMNQKVSNFPGTTMEKKTGYTKLNSEIQARITDLPGTYSLYPKSADELVTYEILRNKTETNFPDVVLFIADASNLKRNLLLLTQVADLGIPVILAMNMLDIAERRGIFYDLTILSQVLGIPVLPLNARKRKGIEEVKAHLLNRSSQKAVNYFSLKNIDPQFLEKISAITQKKNTYAALQYAITASGLLSKKSAEVKKCFEEYHFDARKFQEEEILTRYHIIDKAVRESRRESELSKVKSFSQRVDKVLTHRTWGILIFLGLLFFVFQAIFSWATLPMQWVEKLFTDLSHFAEHSLPPGILNDLFVHGILAGLSGVIIFLPQIMILFAFIAVLEDIGYMARVGFIMDRLMRPFGMNGKSIVPLVSGMACAVPSIMATRSIENRKERLITILVTPLMSCSARLPVYTLLIAMLVPATAKWGPFNLHGIVLMFMYLLGFGAALLSASVFKFFIKTPDRNFFIMELPGYKVPMWSNIMVTLKDKGAAFVWGAGKIIVAVSIVLWALASFGPSHQMEQIEQKYQVMASLPDSGKTADDLLRLKNAEKLEASYAGVFGKWIEPVIKPLGFDWKIGIALLTSLAAREVFVGTMSTIYSVGGNTDDLNSLKNQMVTETDPTTGKLVFGTATVLSLMIFYAFALQCMSTVSVVQAETKSWKWALVQFLYMTLLAYLCSLLVFRLFS